MKGWGWECKRVGVRRGGGEEELGGGVGKGVQEGG